MKYQATFRKTFLQRFAMEQVTSVTAGHTRASKIPVTMTQMIILSDYEYQINSCIFRDIQPMRIP
ncbi:MAG: hypothetical protein A2Z47_00165 [Thermodesulfovibrio sp. RBG_19FT_COMBO_42_12]|nr:MAG: hypothetical protein A2Z47_00165 [Thermodesulfovibrio sp. RBG_19FT_COMBO_42_12]HZX48871.1 hypothetical protein [Nitrospirota bacterium]